jgi:hypothetical protein
MKIDEDERELAELLINQIAQVNNTFSKLLDFIHISDRKIVERRFDELSELIGF